MGENEKYCGKMTKKGPFLSTEERGLSQPKTDKKDAQVVTFVAGKEEEINPSFQDQIYGIRAYGDSSSVGDAEGSMKKEEKYFRSIFRR